MTFKFLYLVMFSISPTYFQKSMYLDGKNIMGFFKYLTLNNSDFLKFKHM